MKELDGFRFRDKLTVMTDKVNDSTNTHNDKFEGPLAKRGRKYRSNEFDNDFMKIYLDQPFLGVISMGISRTADEGVPTAYMGAMRTDRNEYELIMGYNPDFFRSLTAEQRRGVIIHELYHLIFQHVTSRVVADKRMNQLWNVATDLAINSIIGEANLPEFCLFPGKRPQRRDPKTGKMVDSGMPELCEFIEKAPKLQAADFYFEKMKEIIDNSKSGGGDGDDPTGGLSTLDDHDGWGDLPPEIEEELREKVRDMVEGAIKQVDNGSKSWGSIPQEIQEAIRKSISREIDWRSVVRQFVGRCRSSERISSIRRINKRSPYKLPGARRKTHARFKCFIDQSGSMSDHDIALLFGELEGLANETEIEVYHFDTEIDLNSRTIWKKSQPFPKAHRTRCGGTDFQAVADFCNLPAQRGTTDGVMILTDGYAPVMGPIIGAKVLWVITETGTLEITRPGDLAVKMKSKEGGKFQRV